MIVRVRRLPLLLVVLFTIVVGGLTSAAFVPSPAAPATTTPTTSSSDAEAQRLIAHGNDEHYWIGVVKPGAGGRSDETTIDVRSAGNAEWHHLTRLESRAVALNSQGSQLAVLTDGGVWYLITDDSMVTGPALESGSLVTFGNDGRSLWAVGKSKSTTATTASTTPSTSPAATRPSGSSLYLYWLGAGEWNQGVALPKEVAVSNPNVSLAFVDREAYIAWKSKPNQIDIARLAEGNIWEPVGSVPVAYDIKQFKLLSDSPTPTIWVAGAGNVASIHWLDHGKFLSRPAELGKNVSSERSAAVFAAGRIRVLATEDAAIKEYIFDAVEGASAPTTTSSLRLPIGPGTDVMEWILAVAAAGLVLTMLASVRHRDEMRELSANPDRIPPLAPVHRRVIAGVIDASPFLIAVGVLYWMGVLGFRGVNTAASEPSITPEKYGLYTSVLIVTGALYLSHTVFGELVAGRSVGKWIMGLRVVGLDGQPATPGAVVGRNAMRVVDLAFYLLPLSLILLSPLRQRAGDIAAGTLVVTDSPKRTGETEEPPKVPTNTDKAEK